MNAPTTKGRIIRGIPNHHGREVPGDLRELRRMIKGAKMNQNPMKQEPRRQKGLEPPDVNIL